MFECIIPNHLDLPIYNNHNVSYYNEKLVKNYSTNNTSYIYYLGHTDDISLELDKFNTKSVKDLEITIDNQIANEINSYGYNVINIDESKFQDFDKEFKIFTVEISEEVEDYDKLLQIEKTIKEKLNLFSKGIMLEMV